MNSIDNVNSPKHYQIEGLNIESIDIIKAALKDGFSDFCLGNVLKYLIRAEKKNGVEDYKKAKKYLSWINDTVVIDKYELASDLVTNWLSIITGICKGMKPEKALLLNEIFGLIFKGDTELAMDYIDDLIKA